MKNNTITARINDLELEHLKEIKKFREELQNDGTEYSYSDIIRIALSYMYDVEVFGSRTMTYDPDLGRQQQELAKKYWEEHNKTTG